jgi:hypothetical protein
MYYFRILFTLLFTIIGFAITARADTIVLKNGLKLNGTYKGGSETVIKFETSGMVQSIAVSEIKSISFSAASKSAQAARPNELKSAENTAAIGSAAELNASRSVSEIPAGTKIMIKTTEAISTAQHQAGSIVKAVLELDLKVNGTIIAPKGSTVFGTVLESVGGRRVGKQRIIVQFDHLVIDGRKVSIKTDPVGAEGGRGGAAKMVGAGALIGSASGNAGKGAAIGAGVALLAGGKHIQIPADSQVELTIKNNVKF